MSSPELTIESLTAARDLLQKAANTPNVLRSLTSTLETELSAATSALQAAKGLQAIQEVGKRQREATALKISTDQALHSMKARAEAAELSLGQAVMRQERLNQELAEARAEIAQLKEGARKRKDVEKDVLSSLDTAAIDAAMEVLRATKARRAETAHYMPPPRRKVARVSATDISEGDTSVKQERVD